MRNIYSFQLGSVFIFFLSVVFFMATGNFAENVVPKSFSFLNQTIILLIAFLCFLGFALNIFRFISLPKINYAVGIYIIFLFYVLMSVSWSENNASVYARAFAFFTTTLFAFVVAGMVHYANFVSSLFKVQFIFLIVGVILVFVIPSVGIDAADHEGAWKGVFNQKNTFGRSVSLCATLALVVHFSVKNHTPFRKTIAVYITCCFVLLFSSSRTSLVMTLALPLIILLVVMARAVNRTKLFMTVLLLLIAFFVVFLFLSDKVYLGNVSSANDYLSFYDIEILLTGRATLWSFVIHSVDYYDARIFGFGYDGFWGQEESIMYKWGLGDFVANDSHNGFLDIYLQTGLTGLTLFFLSLVSLYMKSSELLKSFQERSVLFGRFLIVMIFFLCLFNLTESTFLKATNVMQFLFSYLFFSTLFPHNLRDYKNV